MYSLPTLPYAYDALEPVIDAKTMEIHHTKHHQAYIDKLNAALSEHADLAALPVEDLLRQFATLPDSIKTAVRNHGGGHANHSLFWTVLTPVSSAVKQPEGALLQAIDNDLGGFAQFTEQFQAAAAGQFGSGWAWLVVENGKLQVLATANQDSPLMNQQTPILGLDVWEHAYYLQYQNRRPDYATAFWQIVNWQEVAKRYTAALG